MTGALLGTLLLCGNGNLLGYSIRRLDPLRYRGASELQAPGAADGVYVPCEPGPIVCRRGCSSWSGGAVGTATGDSSTSRRRSRGCDLRRLHRPGIVARPAGSSCSGIRLAPGRRLGGRTSRQVGVLVEWILTRLEPSWTPLFVFCEYSLIGCWHPILDSNQEPNR